MLFLFAGASNAVVHTTRNIDNFVHAACDCENIIHVTHDADTVVYVTLDSDNVVHVTHDSYNVFITRDSDIFFLCIYLVTMVMWFMEMLAVRILFI
jgi:hypothetical protein